MLKQPCRYKRILLGLLLAAAVSGCANGKQTADLPSPGQTGSAQNEAPAAKQMKIKAYYGDESLSKLNEREVAITYTTDAEKYEAALNALKTAPEGLTPLCKGIVFRSVDFSGGDLVVDLTISDEGRLGAPGEQMLLEAIRQSLFQFAEVKSIDLLVDGKKAESLMGHVSLPHPMKRQ